MLHEEKLRLDSHADHLSLWQKQWLESIKLDMLPMTIQLCVRTLLKLRAARCLELANAMEGKPRTFERLAVHRIHNYGPRFRRARFLFL